MRLAFDWDNAEVLIRVPVHCGDRVETQEHAIHISQFADLVAGQLKIDGKALVAPSALPLPLLKEITR